MCLCEKSILCDSSRQLGPSCSSRVLQVEPGSPTRTPKTLEIRSSASRAGTLVTYLRSREGQLGLLSMAMLIFQGTALSLTLRFSRCGPAFLLEQPYGAVIFRC